MQQLDDVGLPSQDFVAQDGFHVDRLAANEQIDHIHPLKLQRKIQRSCTVLIANIGARAGVDQGCGHFAIASAGGGVQSRHAGLRVYFARMRAFCEEQLHHFGFAGPGGFTQGGCAVIVAGVDLGSVRDQ